MEDSAEGRTDITDKICEVKEENEETDLFISEGTQNKKNNTTSRMKSTTTTTKKVGRFHQ